MQRGAAMAAAPAAAFGACAFAHLGPRLHVAAARQAALSSLRAGVAQAASLSSRPRLRRPAVAAAAAAALSAIAAPPCRTRPRSPPACRGLAAEAEGSSAAAQLRADPRRLIIYSRPGCCLCDGLKEKVDACRQSGGLADLVLEVRDITTRADWEEAYRYEIPVMARALASGSEAMLPRPSPRVSVERLHRQLEEAFAS
eukprot:SM000141S00858  [mRNA]  locus=s141:125668:126760:+ [translate_table: standard]